MGGACSTYGERVSSDQIEKTEMGGACSTYGERVLMGKSKGKRPLERPGHR